MTAHSELNMAKLNEIIKQRDPQVKAASNFLNPDPDTVSVQSGKESSLGRATTKSSKIFILEPILSCVFNKILVYLRNMKSFLFLFEKKDII